MVNFKQKTKAWLVNNFGAVVDNVETWNSYSKHTKDLFSLFDLLAIFNHSIYGIQVTSSGNFSSRHKKMIANKNLFDWLDTDQFAWLVAWKKRKKKWIPKIRIYFLFDCHDQFHGEHSDLIVNDQFIAWEDIEDINEKSDK